MKLQSYEIRCAIEDADLYGAVRILMRYFLLPEIESLPKIRHYTGRGQETEICVWVNDDWYAWHSVSGFTTGSHAYPLYDYDILQVYINFWHPAPLIPTGET